MRVNLRGFHVLVAKLFLNGANIRTRFQQVGGKGMAQSVAGDLLLNARERRRSLNRLVYTRFVNVVSTQAGRFRIKT